MVQPDHFGFNSQTATTNPYQHKPGELHKKVNEIQSNALKEFSEMVEKLRVNGIEVIVLQSRPDVVTPDSIFPNNWFSHHQNNTLVVYPMMTLNRRDERQTKTLVTTLKSAGIKDPEIIDLTGYEEKGLILESTGSMVMDRVNKVAFAMQSPRTLEFVFKEWCRIMKYEGVYIGSTDHHKNEVYHTNLIMSIGTKFAVICSEVIEDEQEKKKVFRKLEKLGKDILKISLTQVHHFCGNILELRTKNNETIIIMSDTARDAFTKVQLALLENYGRIVTFSIPIIEKVGGGGVRCMVAEIFPQV